MPKFEVTVREAWSGSKIVTADNYDDAVNNNLDDIDTEFEEVEEAYAYPCCKFCEQPHPYPDMRLHQGEQVCPDCWDDRLKITE
jgi:formylmethanofuran dehydrogenase subunit E